MFKVNYHHINGYHGSDTNRCLYCGKYGVSENDLCSKRVETEHNDLDDLENIKEELSKDETVVEALKKIMSVHTKLAIHNVTLYEFINTIITVS